MIQWLDGGSDPDVMALLGPVTDVRDEDQRGVRVAEALRLLGRSPGHGSVVLEMSVPRAEHVELTIYDIAGRTVKRLASGTQLRGSWRVPWDGRDESGIAMGSGVYFARMSWPGGARVARVVVLR
jgi:FlgD Ig-like domain